MDNLLEVQNLTIRFGANTVVNDLSFVLPKGKTLAIVGESGSGKSMTALALLGLLPSAAACFLAAFRRASSFSILVWGKVEVTFECVIGNRLEM